MIPRGIRNNNPFNIRKSSTEWLGEDKNGADESFVTFKTPVYGIRAGCKLLVTYKTKYKLNTVRTIISRFAPANENDTEAYIESVAKSVGVGANDVLDVENKEDLENMAKAIIRHENGEQPYDDKTIKSGVGAALGLTIVA